MVAGGTVEHYTHTFDNGDIFVYAYKSWACNIILISLETDNISDCSSHTMYGRPYFLFQIFSFSSKHLAAIISDWPPTCIVRQGFTVTTVP